MEGDPVAGKGFSVSFNDAQLQRLQKKLRQMSEIRFDAVVSKQAADIVDRAAASHNPDQGGTPYDTGEMLQSVGKTGKGISAEVGYTKEYAPHVEFGHRTVNGGWVPGQHFLQNNVDIQRPIFKRDLQETIKETK